MMSFSQFLKDVCEIPVGKITYYERWVAMYLDRLKSSSSNSVDSSPVPFLESLGSKVEKWRIEEAKRAIQLYRYYTQRTTDGQGLESACKTQNAGAPARNEEQPLTASDQGILNELQRVIRLHHLAYRTEKTYRSWAVRFLLFARDRNGTPPTQEHLKLFLSYLAVERRISASTQKLAFNVTVK